MRNLRRARRTTVGLVLAGMVAVVPSLVVDLPAGADPAGPAPVQAPALAVAVDDSAEEPDPLAFTTDYPGLADPAGFGRPYPNAAVPGLLTFRGNPSRSYYGAGPVPAQPRVVARFPGRPMCRKSVNLGETIAWCGMGWTGQPTIAVRADRTWAIFGGYDGNVHFMDAATGQRVLPDVETGDIVKGTPPSTRPATRWSTADRATTCCGSSRSTAPAGPKCSGRSTPSPSGR